jgi:hypothetical protein
MARYPLTRSERRCSRISSACCGLPAISANFRGRKVEEVAARVLLSVLFEHRVCLFVATVHGKPRGIEKVFSKGLVHLFVRAVVAVVLFASQAHAGVLGGGAGGAFGGSLSRGPLNGTMNGGVNGQFAANTNAVGPVERRASGATRDATDDAGKVTKKTEQAGRGTADTVKGVAARAVGPLDC